jgi:hypothetical protein
LTLKIDRVKHALDELIPIYNVVCRKKMFLEQQIKILEAQKFDIEQGQMVFDNSVDF